MFELVLSAATGFRVTASETVGCDSDDVAALTPTHPPCFAGWIGFSLANNSQLIKRSLGKVNECRRRIVPQTAAGTCAVGFHERSG